jgi:hypothetical protein
MGRLIASIADTITTALGKCRGGNDVIHLAMPRVPGLGCARCLLTWLTGGAPVGSQVVVVGHMQPAVAAQGSARVLRRCSLGTLRPHRRWMEPGYGALLNEF